MKRTLSFLKPVYDGLIWAGQGFLAFWRIGRFDYFPTEKNLLLSFWYDFRHFKRVAADRTMYDFLDNRIVYIKRELENMELKPKKRQMYRDLLSALHNPRLRSVIIEFLESPNAEVQYQSVVNAIKSAWRMGEEARVSSASGILGGIELSAPEEDVAGEDVAGPNGGALTDGAILSKGTDTSRPEGGPLLNAKTYVIAAEIHFELANKQTEYRRLSGHWPDLAGFVQQQFGVSRLPGTFRKLKGYSYKKVLEEQKDSKLGQLKPHFRQIIGHPEIFGPAIVKRAQRILDDYFL